MNVNFHLSPSEHIEMVTDEMEMDSSMAVPFLQVFLLTLSCHLFFSFSESLHEHLSYISHSTSIPISDSQSRKEQRCMVEVTAHVPMPPTRFHPTQELYPDY